MTRKLKLCFVLVLSSLFVASADAQQGSKRPSSSSGGSSSQSKPKFSGGSSSPKPSSPKPSTPPPSSSKPKFGGGSSTPPPSSPKPNFGGGSSPSQGNSRKPEADSNDQKARANREATSKRVYEEQNKASVPPKPSYKTPDGKDVKIDPKDKSVEAIRNRPSRDLDPEVRRDYATKHVHHYHYAHPYNYYYAQPYYFVGGGYSSAFWWMMMEWSAERRAQWLYNNRYSIDQSAYEKGIQDAEVRARVLALEQKNAQRQAGYIDPEFQENPTLMYDQEYIEAAYNPNVRTVQTSQGDSSVLGWICLSFVLVIVVVAMVFGLYMLLFVKRFGK